MNSDEKTLTGKAFIYSGGNVLFSNKTGGAMLSMMLFFRDGGSDGAIFVLMAGTFMGADTCGNGG